MRNAVIRGEGLGKRYEIGERARYLALRDVLANAVKTPARLWGSKEQNGARSRREHVWALRDVSFEIQEGEVVGLIGRNGAGKTTLLKILARVTRPTTGFAEVRGRMGSLLEVGTGFHPELTGRENVFLSGAILGMGKREIERKFDEMVAFAEVEKFIDTPLKHYSTGMQMRLAFAVAAHLEPEILLVDEVLAVGDAAFQKKCLGKMSNVAGTGRTIVFVSHQMNQIRRLCHRCIWLDGGQVHQAGPMLEVVSEYEVSYASPPASQERSTSEHKDLTQFASWRITDPQAEQSHVLETFGSVTVEFVLNVGCDIVDGVHGIALFNTEQQLMWATSVNGLKLKAGGHSFRFTLPSLPLKPGAYHWDVSIWDGGSCLDRWAAAPDMVVGTQPVTHPAGGMARNP